MAVVSAYHIKTLVGYFQNREVDKERNRQQEKHPTAIVEEHAVTCWLTFFTFY